MSPRRARTRSEFLGDRTDASPDRVRVLALQLRHQYSRLRPQPQATFPHGAAALDYKQFGFAMKGRAARQRHVHGLIPVAFFTAGKG